MNKARELAYLLSGSGARAMLCLDRLYAAVAGEVIASGQASVDTVITTSELDWQARNDDRVLQTLRCPAATTSAGGWASPPRTACSASPRCFTSPGWSATSGCPCCCPAR
ncbi:MAG TPA: hypothetical protein VFE26_15810 [Trebonia sp.]|nr:hypothetical protein [Trebonia sp.]